MESFKNCLEFLMITTVNKKVCCRSLDISKALLCSNLEILFGYLRSQPAVDESANIAREKFYSYM